MYPNSIRLSAISNVTPSSRRPSQQCLGSLRHHPTRERESEHLELG